MGVPEAFVRLVNYSMINTFPISKCEENAQQIVATRSLGRPKNLYHRTNDLILCVYCKQPRNADTIAVDLSESNVMSYQFDQLRNILTSTECNNNALQVVVHRHVSLNFLYNRTSNTVLEDIRHYTHNAGRKTQP